jgi:hypothetical protein
VIIGRDIASGPALDIDRDALVDERDFLLRSLRDLEAEHGAGDIGDVDYQNLRDDYTARAAAVLRALAAGPSNGRNGSGPERVVDAVEAGRDVAEAAERSRRRWRTSAVVGGILLVGVLAAWAVTASSGSRLANQPITGSLPGATAAGPSPAAASVDPRLLQADQLVQKGKVADALKLYDAVLRDRPNDPQALASEGWLIAQAGMSAGRADLVSQGLAKIQAAETADRSYPTAHFFRAMVLLQYQRDPAGAVTEFRQYLGLVDPSSPEVPQVEQLLQTAIAAAGSNVPPGPNAPTTTKAP